MQYSDTTNKNGIVQRGEFYLGLPDGALTGTLLSYYTGFANDTYLELVYDVLQAQGTFNFDDSGATDYPISEIDTVAGQRDYAFGTALRLLKIKRVDIAYDGTNFYRASPFSTADVGESKERLDDVTPPTAPRYELWGDTIHVYPKPSDASGKIRIEYYRSPELFATTDTTKTPGFDVLFHELVAMGASMRWAVGKRMDVAASLKVLYDQGRLQLRDYYGSKNKDEALAITSSVSIEDYS